MKAGYRSSSLYITAVAALSSGPVSAYRAPQIDNNAQEVLSYL